jgi:hypothetical protein
MRSSSVTQTFEVCRNLEGLAGGAIMSRAWAWIASVIVGLCIVGLIVAGRSDRRTYWIARGMVHRYAEVTPRPIDHLMYRSPGR